MLSPPLCGHFFGLNAMMEAKTIGDVVAFASGSALTPATHMSVLRFLSESLGDKTAIEDVDVDKVYGGKVERNTLHSHRWCWRKYAKMANPASKPMEYARKKRVQSKPSKNRDIPLPDGFMRIPIPLPERGVVVYLTCPADINQIEAALIGQVIKAYAI